MSVSKGALVQVGGRRRFLVALALSELSLLQTCAFDFAISHENKRLLLISRIIHKEIFTTLIKARTLPPSIHSRVINTPYAFLKAQLFQARSQSTVRTQLALGEAVQRAMINNRLSDHDFVYAYDKASALVLSKAKSLNVKAILDQTVAPNDTMQNTLKEAANRLGVAYQGLDDLDLHLIMQEQTRSWEKADVIVCGSDFVKNHLVARGIKTPIYPIRPVLVDSQGQLPKHLRNWNGDRPLRIITVGRASLRKGAHLAIDAAAKLSDAVEWLWLGGVDSVVQSMIHSNSSLKFIGYVKGERLFELLLWADIFVLPSLWEGSAYSVSEAMATGLPCVVTQSTGSWVKHMENGLILSENTTEQVVGAIENFLASPSLVARMSHNTLADQQSYGLSEYQQSLLAAINSTLTQAC